MSNCGCNKGGGTVLKYRVQAANGEAKDFATKGEADGYRTTNQIAAPVRAVRVKA
ncbi:hypothetical protein AB0F17_28690 [Nonomuraea sp. NPDC026600]|uniref:hypothetical protein n=1 Tax=Nonomuraea sp. NPDC026600 TaxID=3155363 RepID=UPI0033E75032